MSVLSGDIVRYDGREWVTVDVDGGDEPSEQGDGWISDDPAIWSST